MEDLQITEKEQTLILSSEADTAELAGQFAPHLRVGMVMALYGDLGCGKTFFTRELCHALQVRENVSSPSYVLINQYSGIIPVTHVDLYRLRTLAEVLELGLPEFFENSLTVIEWPELAEPLLPADSIRLRFEFDNDFRKVKILL
ncbi:MAG: tRNA (adenosine(37)-N6)-threonylcarbamoyltransferase complex ATPase subunit type 1 TsaE [Candidatus Cloacimonetes bacterium]|nr:tRNA (adenosine(37)-N6)-threonylcarbamoyltransferase complex ATPase subunit type 1 TsaE [Candidatus Cloacimonadota bacterium]